MAKKNRRESEVEADVAEIKQEEPEVVLAPRPPKVSFSAWYVMREKRIPAQHMKEIIWADFKARGMSDNETITAYDSALAAYGVIL